MALISDGDKKIIKEEFFSKLINPVRLLVFIGKDHCQYCDQLKQLVEEISELSNLVTYELHDFDSEKELAEKYRINIAPAVVITQGGKDLGVRYFGLPAGNEFGSFLEDIVDVSKGETDLLEETKEALKGINKDVQIYVFVTPTCPYCPMAVRMAHKFAIEHALAGNDKILGNMIEAIEFPELADQYGVMAVPKVVIKVDGEDKVSFEGAYPEKMFLEKLLEALE
ncbi:MAG: thioredoxin family protein [Thermococcus sp.]|uniref:protein disulfide oxidoreductase n=1 Tax=Thermococcus sp. TaxID=35749 RepID=UPI000BCD1802|nr:thioredoxin family protein [Thermococcus sp.]OYT33019.1 MAG: glutaredoxin [Archaeoglobales archaeon ex4484_92]RLF81937.1 MAG: glutaredoxin [Thermococci archaeon]MCD6140458.1 thioredoxin family protein [Thermococcus sp.]MCD6144110.1 thioredoxin family protein [Thermococcus sp.]RLF84732.1 MAG: glutaredoxin [Thermococci archaeon]